MPIVPSALAAWARSGQASSMQRRARARAASGGRRRAERARRRDPLLEAPSPQQLDHRRLRTRVARVAERARDADARGRAPLAALVELPQLREQRLDRPRLAEPLDHALGGEPALGQGPHERGHGIGVLREGEGRRPPRAARRGRRRRASARAWSRPRAGEGGRGSARRGRARARAGLSWACRRAVSPERRPSRSSTSTGGRGAESSWRTTARSTCCSRSRTAPRTRRRRLTSWLASALRYWRRRRTDLDSRRSRSALRLTTSSARPVSSTTEPAKSRANAWNRSTPA